MHITFVIAMWAAAVAPQDPQDGQEEPPPKPVVELPTIPPVEPRPRLPLEDRFSFRMIALRPRWELTTREFDVGMFSGEMQMGDVGDFGRTSLGFEARFDLGNWLVSATAMFQSNHASMDRDTTFEQHTFLEGTEVDTTAFFGTAEAFYRFDVLGSAAETTRVSLLAGVNFSKIYLGMEDDRRLASEGFSALWPLPALGLEARVWLSDRISLNLLARGTRMKFDNPFQLDAGGSQEMTYLYGRIDAGIEWMIADKFSISLGYTGISASVRDSSVEDTDSANLKASGIYGGITLQF